ncbi:sulfurtransferase TusA family protein [Streptomyces scabiei]|uniref:sulfurtransferase TusA family protein n=1 Tax=Streptomyces scabiei TaxID=1930 RepID=UPI0038F5F702
MTRPTHGIPPPDITVDGTGLLRITLLLRPRKEIAGTEPGTVVHVIATDPAAPLDLPARCHMTGHHHLGHVGDPARVGPVAGDRRTYALRLTADARPPARTRRGTWPKRRLTHRARHARRGRPTEPRPCAAHGTRQPRKGSSPVRPAGCSSAAQA